MRDNDFLDHLGGSGPDCWVVLLVCLVVAQGLGEVGDHTARLEI
jgi:hypothetical protein